jgi:hypothetical protein
MNITDQFPEGRWNDANSHFVVKQGCYWEVIAVRDGAAVVLTPLGQSLTPPMVETLDVDATAPGILPPLEFPRKGKRQ